MQVVAAVLSDAGQVGDRVDAERRQSLAVTDAGEFQQMRALHRPGRNDHLLAGAHEAPLGALDVLDAHGAPVVDADAVGARAGTHRQRFTTARGIEVGLAAAVAQAPLGVSLQDADALVLRAVVVGASPGCRPLCMHGGTPSPAHRAQTGRR